MFPDASIATPAGILSMALVAGPPSPPKPEIPLPATVLIIPVTASTRRTLLVELKPPPPLLATVQESDKYMLPAESNFTSHGSASWAAVARTPSPPVPPPATVVIIEELAFTARTRWPEAL